MTSMITETLAITGPLHREAECGHISINTQKTWHFWSDTPVGGTFPHYSQTHTHACTCGHTHTVTYIPNLATSRSDAIPPILVLAPLLDPLQENKLCLAHLRWPEITFCCSFLLPHLSIYHSVFLSTLKNASFLLICKRYFWMKTNRPQSWRKGVHVSEQKVLIRSCLIEQFFSWLQLTRYAE